MSVLLFLLLRLPGFLIVQQQRGGSGVPVPRSSVSELAPVPCCAALHIARYVCRQIMCLSVWDDAREPTQSRPVLVEKVPPLFIAAAAAAAVAVACHK